METKWAYLAGSAGFSTVPAAVSATVAREGGAAAQKDVEDHPETPKITALVVERGLISEHLHNFWSHVLCWATLREGKCIEHTLKNYITVINVTDSVLCACAMSSKNGTVTGVVSSGVVMGVQALLSFTPLPKSKSQILTGDTYVER